MLDGIAPLAQLGLGIAGIDLHCLACVLGSRHPVLQFDVHLGTRRPEPCVLWLCRYRLKAHWTHNLSSVT
jgi:hypothetical protein